MSNAGSQVVLSNEFDEKTCFYKFVEVERMIRIFSLDAANNYFATTFACCREVYKADYHKGKRKPEN